MHIFYMYMYVQHIKQQNYFTSIFYTHIFYYYIYIYTHMLPYVYCCLMVEDTDGAVAVSELNSNLHRVDSAKRLRFSNRGTECLLI
jgi:hypothetical protein